MTFSIKLLPNPVSDLEPGVRASYGRIEIAEFQERFIASLMYWCADDYERQWKEAIARIVYTADVSCLITSIVDPTTASHLFWWPMYRVGDVVHIQHQILFFSNLSSSFNEEHPYSFVPRRRILDEDGNQISEWTVSIKSVESFLQEITLSESSR